MTDDLTFEQVEKILALAEATTYELTLDAEAVKQLCNGWIAWANYG